MNPFKFNLDRLVAMVNHGRSPRDAADYIAFEVASKRILEKPMMFQCEYAAQLLQEYNRLSNTRG